MKILITGSSGMLGIDLVEAFAKDYDVVGLDFVPCTDKDSKAQDFLKVDITDPESCGWAMQKVKPDVVINAAAWADVDGCERDPEKAYRINAEGARNIAEAASLFGALVVHISTDFIFDGTKETPYIETDEVKPLGVYANSKLKAEELIEECASSYLIVRTSWLYGEGGKNFVETILTKAAEGEKLRVVYDQVGSPTYTVDLAEAIKCLIDRVEQPVKEVVHVSNSGSCSWHYFAVKILEFFGRGENDAVEEIGSDELDRPAKRPSYSVLDTGKFTRITGHKMRDWKEALETYLKRRGK